MKYFYIEMNLSCASVTFHTWGNYSIKDDNFTISGTIPSYPYSIEYTFVGTFVSQSEAQGTWYYKEGYYGCWGSGTWTAEKLPLPDTTPTVSIYTNKTNYTTGEKMHLGLDVKNPLESAQRVSLDIYLETPLGRNYTLIDTTVTLPPKLNYSNPHFKVFTLPGIPAGTYTWHAILDDPVTGEIICEDTTSWEFVSTKAPTSDITEILEQTVVVIDFAE